MKQDIYAQALSQILNDLETVYGLKRMNEEGSSKLCDLDIDECLMQLKVILASSTKEQSEERDRKALKSIVHLSYVSSRMRFYRKVRLDYSKYPNMGEISSVLVLFTQRIEDMESFRKINSIVVILNQIDQKTAKMRNAMGYRFLRIFVVILLSGNLSHASIVADFILNQFII